jgi:hypothetical protein
MWLCGINNLQIMQLFSIGYFIHTMIHWTSKAKSNTTCKIKKGFNENKLTYCKIMSICGVNVLQIMQFVVIGNFIFKIFPKSKQQYWYNEKMVYSKSLDGYKFWDNVYTKFEWIIMKSILFCLEYITINIGPPSINKSKQRNKI